MKDFPKVWMSCRSADPGSYPDLAAQWPEGEVSSSYAFAATLKTPDEGIAAALLAPTAPAELSQADVGREGVGRERVDRAIVGLPFASDPQQGKCL
jgi:hypothetical protein